MTQRILGPTGGRRRRRFATFVPLGLLAALVLAIGAAAGPVSDAAGFQGDDGNLVDERRRRRLEQLRSRRVEYRHRALPAGGEGGGRRFDFLGIEDDDADNSDTAFAGGTKQDDNCATVGGAKAPNKDDIKRDLPGEQGRPRHRQRLPGARRGSGSRRTRPRRRPTSASSSTRARSPVLRRVGGLVQRTAGDMLFVYDFEGGSADDPDDHGAHVGHLGRVRGRQQQPALLGAVGRT